jgi:hypothetical protein
MPSPRPHVSLRVLAVAYCLAGGTNAFADTLPYSLRTHAYGGFQTGVRGDIRTVGMAGATLGLSDTFIAALDNPAGLAMTMNIGDDNVSSTRIEDAQIQNFEAPIVTSSAGVALNMYPWGFSAGYVSPYQEGQTYGLLSQPGQASDVEVAIKELRFSAARVFWSNRLAVGLSLRAGQAGTSASFVRHDAYALGLVGGASYQLPYRLILGAGLSSAMHYAGTTSGTPPVPGLFQDVDYPWTGGLGVGWIPNRYFRADFSTFGIGTSPNASLLSNDNTRVGRAFTLQPKIGAAYVFCDFKNLVGTLFAGTYYENSRIDGAISRYHKTGGLEVKPWIFTVGFGIDAAPDYQDYAASINVDIFKMLEQFSMIPSRNLPHVGLLPNPFFMSDLGLAPPLVKDWESDSTGIDPIQVGIALPGKVLEGVSSVATDGVQKIISIPARISNELKGMADDQNKTAASIEKAGLEKKQGQVRFDQQIIYRNPKKLRKKAAPFPQPGPRPSPRLGPPPG